MPTNATINRKAVAPTSAEKAKVAAGKAIVSVLSRGDAAALNEYARNVKAMTDVLTQEGEGQGKRFAGATGHDFQAQATALANIILRGNVPTFA